MDAARRPILRAAVALALSALLALPACGPLPGYGPRTSMSGHDASDACLEELAELIEASDAEGLVAAFSEAARADDGLAEKAEELMEIIGGCALSDGHFWSSRGSRPSGHIYVISTATLTAPDGTRWQLHVTDCTYNGDDPSKVGIRLLEVIPEGDAPQGFGWHSTSLNSPVGIRLITSWDGWDPWTSPRSPDW